EDLSISSRILGMNITGAKTSAVYGDMNGLIYERMQMETPADRPFLEGFDAVCAQADKLMKVCRAQGLPSPEAISLAVSGPVNLLKGEMVAPPDLPTWEGAQLKGRFTVRYNLPVFVEQRSQAAALAEANFGAGIGLENVVLVDMEPVVSAGLVLNKAVYHGGNDIAGEFGGMKMAEGGPAGLGRPGSLTGFASGLGIAELAHLRYPAHWTETPAPYELVRDVRNGDEEALAVVAEAGEHLGKALSWLVAILDPDLVVFGHPGDLLGDTLFNPLQTALSTGLWGCQKPLPRLTGAKLGSKLDDVAALMAVINSFKNRS
ncbi:MAG: ROK family protein, partial [Anaerolineaceae bacterium]|nr:ROK family protein [Anaerolineaceae bacterium]